MSRQRTRDNTGKVEVGKRAHSSSKDLTVGGARTLPFPLSIIPLCVPELTHWTALLAPGRLYFLVTAH